MESNLSPFTVAIVLSILGSLSTVLGGVLTVLSDNPDQSRLGFMQGVSSGVMIFISYTDLLVESEKVIGFDSTYLSFFVGVLLMAIVVKYIPEPHFILDELPSEADTQDKQRSIKKYLFSGIVTAMGIALHNFPEGIAVYLGSIKKLSFGVALALAMMIHNLPEGMAVAMPIYYATKSKWYAVRITAYSAVFEPLGVIACAAFFQGIISEFILHTLFGIVAGVMVFLVVHELFPLSIKFCGAETATKAVFLGMVICYISLSFLKRLEKPYQGV